MTLYCYHGYLLCDIDLEPLQHTLCDSSSINRVDVIVDSFNKQIEIIIFE